MDDELIKIHNELTSGIDLIREGIFHIEAALWILKRAFPEIEEECNNEKVNEKECTYRRNKPNKLMLVKQN